MDARPLAVRSASAGGTATSGGAGIVEGAAARAGEEGGGVEAGVSAATEVATKAARSAAAAVAWRGVLVIDRAG